MTVGDDPFRAYHRARWWMTLRRTVTSVTVSAAVVVGLALWVGAAPPPAEPTSAIPAAAVPPAENPPTPVAQTETAAPVAPDPVAPSPDPAPPTALAPTGPRVWSISVDTTGYQAELDECLWVRMDLGAAAPIVGAHNYCGGGIVLDMAVGDLVTLTGTGLDGTYSVTGDRGAHAGDGAATATAGMDADVILQTCYWIDDGSERLVGLRLVG